MVTKKQLIKKLQNSKLPDDAPVVVNSYAPGVPTWDETAQTVESDLDRGRVYIY